jgi:hypothetical protein
VLNVKIETMPCPKCGTLAIQFGAYTICPNCNKIPLLNRYEATVRLLRNEEQVENAVFQIMRAKLSKKDLLIKLFWEREAFCRSFFAKYQAIDTNKFLTSNFLIFRINKDCDFNGTIKASQQDIDSIVNGFKKIIESKESRLLIMEGLGEPLQIFNKIHVLFNEKYFPILKTYEDNDILQQSKADAKLIEYSRVLEEEMKKSNPKEKYSPERFTEQFYPVINQFYCCFLRNEIYKEVFGLLDRFSNELNPHKLMDLVNSYPVNDKSLFHTALPEFIDRANKFLGMPKKRIKELLIFNEKNTEIFPVFLELNGRVYISHQASFIFYILLHAIIYRNLFDRETEKRSKELENQEVRMAFQEIGWKYLTNLTDGKKPTIEIDGIAISQSRIVVVECKGWKLKPFYEYLNQQNYLVRDIKGVIDGQKYTNQKPEKVKGLLEKINCFKANMQIWNLDKAQFNAIDGLLVLRAFSPIPEYKGIPIISVKEIAKRYA